MDLLLPTGITTFPLVEELTKATRGLFVLGFRGGVTLAGAPKSTKLGVRGPSKTVVFGRLRRMLDDDS